MSPEVEHSEQVKEFLRTHPRAEELRLAIAFIGRGQPPADSLVALDPRDQSMGILEVSGRCITWHWEGTRLVIEDIIEPT